ncbi:MAG TPA: lipid A biosynthesis [Phycisphaerales bacterium]|nr:lipid A biosynthesis [Phycisphaerales bacterium]
MAEVERQIESWESRPAVERTLLGFFNITDWGNFAWVTLGLAGQVAFFGRMLVQWITSERRGESVVPELFWWLSLMGGVCLFTYFVWRVDFVGVLGQSTGVVVYARNLRLIYKKKRRTASAGEPSPGGSTQKGTGDARVA